MIGKCTFLSFDWSIDVSYFESLKNEIKNSTNLKELTLYFAYEKDFKKFIESFNLSSSLEKVTIRSYDPERDEKRLKKFNLRKNLIVEFVRF